MQLSNFLAIDNHSRSAECLAFLLRPFNLAEDLGVLSLLPLPDCAENVVAEPDGSVAMAYKDQIDKLAFKIAAV